jgi:drug/metabolite transporter (DMT)-like permease
LVVLIVCILANVLIAIIFKLFPKFGINNFQAIVFNYITCLIVGTLQLGEFPIPTNVVSLPWFPYTFFLGFLFVAGFNLNAQSNQKIGISYTALIQKLTLVVPTLIAILLFGETINTIKILGIMGAILAIFLIQLPSKQKANTESLVKQFALLGLGVYLIAATIETTLFYMNIKGISSGADISVVSTVFGIAGLIGLVIMLSQVVLGKTKFQAKNILAGIVLGIPNFYSIYLLLYLLAEGWEASVMFPLNNVGIIALSALSAFLFFQERMNLWKWIGLVIAILSIFLISFS